MSLYTPSVHDTTQFNYFSGGGMPAIGVPIDNPDPAQDYIAAGPGRFTPTIPQLLPADLDDVSRAYGLKTYEAMLTDPAVWSSFLALKLSILSGPIQVMPAIRPKGYRYKPPGEREQTPPPLGGKGGGAGKSGDPDGAKIVQPDKAPDPREKRAMEIAEFCERDLKRPKTPVKAWALQMLDAMGFGNKLSEKTRIMVESGPDKGKLGMDSIRVKPHWAWRFVVNCHMDVKGVLTYVPPMSTGGPNGESDRANGGGGIPAKDLIRGGFLILPREKFCIFTWLGRDHDPRGVSALRPAYDWWNLKRQMMPQYYKFLTRFGTPSLDGELSDKDVAYLKPVDPRTGKEYPGITAQSPTMRYFNQLIAYQNSSVIVRPAGSKLNILEPKSEGEAFLKGFELFDRSICLAIGLQTRASLEAEHGSKADSETAEDTRGLVISYGRESFGEMIGREWFYDSIKLNFSEEDAEEFCPVVVVGKAQAHDKPALWTAASSLGVTIGPSQLPEMDAILELPDRDIDADMAAEMDKMEKAAAIAGPMDQPEPRGAGNGSGGKSASPSGGQGKGTGGGSK